MTSDNVEFESFAEHLEKHGIPETWVRANARSAAALHVTEAPASLGASKLGGPPHLPRGAAWPRWDVRARAKEALAQLPATGIGSLIRALRARLERRASAESRPLAFLGQLALGDLVDIEHGLPLPSDGLLSFFYDADEQPWGYDPADRAGFQVRYTPPDHELMVHDVPVDLESDARFQEVALRATRTWTLPDWTELDESFGEEMVEDLMDALESFGDGLPVHRVGGFPDQIQGDMREECQLVTAGVFMGGTVDRNSEEVQALRAGADEWRLLLQVDSDDAPGWMWGDAGSLYFWMRESDIRDGRWERAWCVLQCC